MTPWTIDHQASLSMGFFRQEYWSGLPLPSPGHLSNPRIKPRSPAWQADSLLSEPPTGWSLRLRGLGTGDDTSAENQLKGSHGRGRPGGRVFSAEGAAVRGPSERVKHQRGCWLLGKATQEEARPRGRAWEARGGVGVLS